jgi:signal transduction histidine kinase
MSGEAQSLAVEVTTVARGIAHDLNDVLGTIIANSHFLMNDISPGDPRRVYAEEITRAVERATGLSRRLLAFGPPEATAEGR